MDGYREGPDSSFSINRIEYYAVIVEVLGYVILEGSG